MDECELKGGPKVTMTMPDYIKLLENAHPSVELHDVKEHNASLKKLNDRLKELRQQDRQEWLSHVSRLERERDTLQDRCDQLVRDTNVDTQVSELEARLVSSQDRERVHRAARHVNLQNYERMQSKYGQLATYMEDHLKRAREVIDTIQEIK